MENDGDSCDDGHSDDRTESSTDVSNYSEGKSGACNSKEESGEEEEEDEVEDTVDNPKGILLPWCQRKEKCWIMTLQLRICCVPTNHAKRNVTLGSLGGNPVIGREEEEKIGIELVAYPLMIITKVHLIIVVFIIMCHSCFFHV